MKTKPNALVSFTRGPQARCLSLVVPLLCLLTSLPFVACPVAGWAAATPVPDTGKKPAIPDTPAGRAFAAWLDIFNTGDSAAMARFAREHWVASNVTAEVR